MKTEKLKNELPYTPHLFNKKDIKTDYLFTSPKPCCV